MPTRNSIKTFLHSHKILQEASGLILLNDYSSAQEILRNLLTLDNQTANIYYLYYICLKRRDLKEQAQKIKVQAYKMNPCFYECLKNDENQIVKYIKSSSKEASEQVSKNDDKEYEVRYNPLINLFNKKKDLNSGLRVLQMYEENKAKQQSTSRSFHSSFGLAYYEIGYYEQSLQKYRIAIGDSSDEFRYYNNSSIITYILGDYEKSEQFVVKALQIKPGYAKSFFIISFVLAKTNRVKQSMEKIQLAEAESPNSTMYKFKVIINLILYEQDYKQTQRKLKQLNQIIDKGSDGDSYFFCNDNRPLLDEAAKFLAKYFEYPHKNMELWKDYVNLMDDYLIKGHTDKYFITQKMRKIRGLLQAQMKTKQAGLLEQNGQANLYLPTNYSSKA